MTLLTQDCDFQGCRGTDNQYICRRCESTGQTNRERDAVLLNELAAENCILRAQKRKAEDAFCGFHTREYLYAGMPIHRKAIECRNAEIDELRASLASLQKEQLELARAVGNRLAEIYEGFATTALDQETERVRLYRHFAKDCRNLIEYDWINAEWLRAISSPPDSTK